MKDALGHGSDAHGAGVASVGHSFLPVIQGSGRDKNYYVQHAPTQKWLGTTLMFKKQKEGEDFVNTHLDPTNTWWRDAPNLMSNVYAKAAEKFSAGKETRIGTRQRRGRGY